MKNHTKPNILFILTDQQRHDALSIAGNEMLQTPNLDRLAREGVYFRQAVCSWPVCGPARASLFTGLYPHNHGLYENSRTYHEGGLTEDVETWEETLTGSGYRCEYWGKWHTGSTHRHCYDNEIAHWRHVYKKYCGKKYGKLPVPANGEINGGSSGQPYVPCELEMTLRKMDPPKRGIQFGLDHVPHDDSLTAFTVHRTIEALRRLAAENTPFSLTCSIIAPHAPWILPSRWYDLYDPVQMPRPSNLEHTLLETPYEGHGRIVADNFPKDYAEGLGRFMSLYYGSIAELDHYVGMLLSELSELGLEQQTLVIFTSDHGEMLGAHGMMGKGIFFEGSVRVPLIIRYPAQMPGGCVVNEVVNQTDLAPTILDYAGIDSSDPCDGRSLRALLEEEYSWPEFTVAEYGDSEQPAQAGRTRPGGQGGMTGDRMIRSREWKYIVRADWREGLYDLRVDPLEYNNLLCQDRSGEVDETYRRIQGALLEHMQSTSDPSLDGFQALMRTD